ncbi:Carboxypeptidase regulatory-like domain-containing protein [Granulicella pectinivorans]|jgi:hypothetical protein|uniref:Carboxypeptidase regulatory-like domain-containing protein n=1 Tax=Granulicella pectinivorans TaxID=474950 RepID=A0A1I6L101_9BACT|nr:carboxypeptidase-like regulatory domain-containing protein [Granulicella pectinivorans]SFR97116.1 Carboxypeptidase regulatory-like domain-containing protein [Granulicella pectinivorans]
MPGFPSRTTILLCLTLMAPLALHAQEGTRNLTGSVTDTSREPLRGAVVQLENQNTHGIVSFITDRRGTYSFKRIGNDTDYKIWATFRGIRSKERQLDKFDTRKDAEIDLVIALH